MDKQIETIQFNLKFKEKTLTVKLESNQTHNNNDLNETHRPISLNLTKNDTILLIKHIEKELNMGTDVNQSSSEDLYTADEMMGYRPQRTDSGLIENTDALSPNDPEEKPSTQIKLFSTLHNLLMDIRGENNDDNFVVKKEEPSSSNEHNENSTKVKLLSILDSLLMDIRGKDGVTSHPIYAELERMKLEHATEIEAINLNYNESLVDANQKIEQMQRQIDELENEHATDVEKHAKDAIQNSKMVYENNQNQKIQELETRCRELQIELQKKEVKSNEDLMSASESAKSQNTRMKFDHQREIQEMTETHEQIVKKLTDKITKLKNTNSGDLMQYNHEHEPDQVLNGVKSDASNLGESAALNERMDHLEQSLIETRKKYESEIIDLKLTLENERMHHHANIARCQKTNMELTEQVNELDTKLKKQELVYEEDYKNYISMLAKKDGDFVGVQTELQINNDKMIAMRSLMDEQNGTITALRANLAQQAAEFNKQQKAEDVLNMQYKQKISVMQQAYLQQLHRIGSDMNSGRFAYEENGQG